MPSIIIGLGSNMGDRGSNINNAKDFIGKELGQVLLSSGLYETKAWGNTNQANFYNCAIEVETALFPLNLIAILLNIETQMGRVRTQKWSERIIDLDILFYDDVQISTPGLCIPHPFIQERNFVLDPLMEICPDFIHPKFLKSISQLKKESNDTSWIKKI